MNELSFLIAPLSKWHDLFLRRVAMSLDSDLPRRWYGYLRPGCALGKLARSLRSFPGCSRQNTRSWHKEGARQSPLPFPSNQRQAIFTDPYWHRV